MDDLTVPPLAEDAMDAVFDVVGHGTHGKLEGLAVWLAGVQGCAPPRPLTRRRVVVFGKSDLDGDVRGGGSFADGRALADAQADEGADVVVVVAPPTAGAAALVAALTDTEPVSVVPPGPGWAVAVGEVRDALRRVRGAGPLDLAESLGEPALVGFVAQAARRRTPVVLDGMAPAAAALAAERVAPGVVTYCAAGHLTPHPAHRLALDALGLAALLDLGISADGAALHALPLLDAAVALAAPATP